MSTALIKVHQVSYAETRYFSSLLQDYVKNKNTLAPFTAFEYHQNGLELAVQKRLETPRRINGLSEIVLQQYKDIRLTSATEKNIRLLDNPDTVVVVTAHQLSFLGGPLYYVLKIANAVRQCCELSLKYPDKNFVPVYWAGSEDHDFEEINHIRLFGKTITWNSFQGGATGRYQTKDVADVLEEVKNILGNSIEAKNLHQLLEQAYLRPNLMEAGRYLVHQLFGEMGLVVVDGDDAALKKTMIPVFKAELQHQVAFPLVQQQSAALTKAGYHAQATAREINLFYLSENKRERITLAEGVYSAGDFQWAENEIIEELEKHPERFSPNVILRPLYQQTILPAAVFIGGGGELAYWMQLKPIFEHFGVFYPFLQIRNSVLLISSAQKKKMEKLQLEILDLFKDVQELKKEFLFKNAGIVPELTEEKQKIEAVLLEIRAKMEQTDATLGPFAGAESQKILQQIENLQQRMLKAEKQKHETALLQLEQLKNQLFPNQNLQEREDNFMNYYSRYGQSFIEMLVENCCPLSEAFLVMELP